MSKALQRWRGTRAARLDALAAAHAGLRGHKTVHSEYLNWSLLLALSGEFHGFTRELHDLAVDAFVAATAPGNERLADIVRAHLAHGRAIGKGNPQPDALAADFGRFGLALWPSLGDGAAAWRESLATLTEARNAVAHADMPRLATVRARGYGLSVRTITGWRRDLDALAAAMDACVATHHASLFATAKPW